MPSSISSSEGIETKPGITRATWALVVCAIFICLGTEGAARFGLGRISKIHQRIMAEQRAAEALRQAPAGQPQTILFAGNSLLETGLDIPLIQSKLQGRYKPQRFIVEATNYYDWYYALKRLFRGGMRPDVVVVALHAAQLTTKTIRGDFSAHFLFDLQDLWPMSRNTGADLTRTSGYYAAHWSTFYAARSELRAVIIGKLLPSVPILWGHAIFSPAVLPSDEALAPVIQARLTALDQLCRQYNARFIFLVPLTFGGGDTVILQAGQRAGVRVLRPLPNNSLSADYYEPDRFHLNDKGAVLWTKALARQLLAGSDSGF